MVTTQRPFIQAYKDLLQIDVGTRDAVSGAVTKWVLLAIIDREATGNFPVSYAALGEDIGGLSRRTVFRAVERLRKGALVRVIRRSGHGLVLSVNHEKLGILCQKVREKWESRCATMASQMCHDGTPDVPRWHTYKTKTKDTSSRSTSTCGSGVPSAPGGGEPRSPLPIGDKKEPDLSGPGEHRPAGGPRPASTCGEVTSGSSGDPTSGGQTSGRPGRKPYNAVNAALADLPGDRFRLDENGFAVCTKHNIECHVCDTLTEEEKAELLIVFNKVAYANGSAVRPTARDHLYEPKGGTR